MLYLQLKTVADASNVLGCPITKDSTKEGYVPPNNQNLSLCETSSVVMWKLGITSGKIQEVMLRLKQNWVHDISSQISDKIQQKSLGYVNHTDIGTWFLEYKEEWLALHIPTKMHITYCQENSKFRKIATE